jgi:Gpi18-like mannosyltransferase
MISLAAFLWAAWYFARIAADVLDDTRARGALLLLASYPFAMFFSAAYTESLFLLAALGAWHSFRHGRLATGSVWGLLAGLARPNGFFLSVPLGLIALGGRDARSREGGTVPSLAARLVVASMPVLGMLLFTIYLYSTTGEWFAWARLHAAWGRRFTGELPPLVAHGGSADSLLDLIVAHPYDALNAMGVAFALAMAWPVWRPCRWGA